MRFRFRFRLVTLMAMVTVLCTWLGMMTRRAHQQRDALAVLEQAGARIEFDYQVDVQANPYVERKSNAPAWARRLFGEEYFRTPVTCTLWSDPSERRRPVELGLRAVLSLRGLRSLRLYDMPLSTEQLQQIATLSKLTWLNLDDCTIADDGGFEAIGSLHHLVLLWLENTNVSDHDLLHLAELVDLSDLSLNGTKITDEGVKTIARMRGLNFLRLRGTSITDKGLVHLATMTALEALDLHDTNITGTGLSHLSNLSHLNCLDLDDTELCDESLRSISQLRSLQVLSISGTRVTSAGMAQLAEMPKLGFIDLHDTAIDDAGLEQLGRMSNLSFVNLTRTKTSAEGRQRLQLALPSCAIETQRPDYANR